MRKHPAFWSSLALLIVTLAVNAFAQSAKDKPRVPPGVDPGGVAVAIIGGGIDYTNPAIAKRLARDGEGEIIGWDFVDNDRRPYASCATAGSHGCPGQLLSVFLESRPPPEPTAPINARQAIRLAPFRASMANPQSLTASVQAIARADVRIVALMLDPPPPHAFLLEAAKRFPALIFVGTVADFDPSKQIGPNFIATADKQTGVQNDFNTTAYAAMAAECSSGRSSLSQVMECTTASAGPRKQPQP